MFFLWEARYVEQNGLKQDGLKQNNAEQKDFDISSALRFTVRGLLFALPIALLAGLLTYFLAQRLEPVYQATATLLIAQAPTLDSASPAELSPPAPLSAEAYRVILLSDQTLVAALGALGVDPVDQARLEVTRKNMGVVVTEDAGNTDVPSATLLSVSYQGSSPSASAETANALSAALIRWDETRLEEKAQRSSSALKQQIGVLNEDIASLEQASDPASQEDLSSLLALRTEQQRAFLATRAMFSAIPGFLSAVQPAMAPLGPVAPRPLRYAALASVSAALLVLGCLLLSKLTNTRLRTAEDIRLASDLRVLSELERASGTQQLRTAVNLLCAGLWSEANRPADDPGKVLLVTSPESTGTKAWFAAELAESFAVSDYRTLLIDLDVVRPVLASFYNLEPSMAPGLSAYLSNPKTQRLSGVELGYDKRLALLPAFETDLSVAGRIGRSVRQVLPELQRDFDVIVISAAPVLTGADTLAVASSCSDAFVVVELGRVERVTLQRAVERLRGVGVASLSAVPLHAKAAPKKARLERAAPTGVSAPSQSARSG